MAKRLADNDNNISTKIVVTRFEQNIDAIEVSGEKIVKILGYFSNQKFDYNMEKVICPENTIYYVNQGYLTVQKNKKILYINYCILGQIIKTSNPPENIDTYILKDREVEDNKN